MAGDNLASTRHHGYGDDRGARDTYRMPQNTVMSISGISMSSEERTSSNQTMANQPIAYLIPAGLSRDEAVAKLIGRLVGQGVEVFRLDNELHVSYGPQILQRTNSANEKLGTYRTIIVKRLLR